MDPVLQLLNEENGERDYFASLKLNDEDSKNDPVTEPYRSMYAAREIWLNLKSRVDSYANENPTVDHWTFLSAALDLKLGQNFGETEEKSMGEKHLQSCVDRLDDFKLDARGCNVAQIALNQLGILAAEMITPKKGLDCLIRAELLHGSFVEKVGTSPWTVDDLFRAQSYTTTTVNDERELEKAVQRRTEVFEDTYTHTLFFLAQVYEKVGDSEMSARYCHETLRRQLNSHKYVPVDWAMHAATLAQYYLAINRFTLSRHCLASAELILKETGDQPASLYVDMTQEDDASSLQSRERIPKAWADLSRCWAKYGLALLEYSREKLYKEVDGIDQHADPEVARKAAEAAEDESKDGDAKMFFNLELTSIESKVRDSSVCIFSEARDLFLRTQTWLTTSADFYRIDGHCSDNVEIIRDHSTLFKLLAFFEPDLDRQCKMHKRRADLLSAVLAQLNPQYYLLICRQLMFELAETYSMMLDNKLALVELNGVPPTEHARNKINTLTRQSIDQFQAYINTLKSPAGQLPAEFQEDDERPALAAHFYIGRLHSKFIERDIAKQLRNVRSSLDNYTYLVTYCRANPNAIAKVKSELDICEEMVLLLPAKMDKLLAKMTG